MTTTLRELAGASLAYLALTVYFTWPLARVGMDHLVTDSRLLVPDLYLVTWILASVAHALGTNPGRLFEGNAFHPTPTIIAGSEHLLGDQLVFAPIWLGTGNPILALNVLTATSFVLAALLMHLLVWRWSGSRAAAYVAGFAFAFAPWRGQLGRAHLLHVEYRFFRLQCG